MPPRMRLGSAGRIAVGGGPDTPTGGRITMARASDSMVRAIATAGAATAGIGEPARVSRAGRDTRLPRLLRRRLGLARVPIHRNVARLIDEAVEPGADRGKLIELEVALVREVRVAIERDV